MVNGHVHLCCRLPRKTSAPRLSQLWLGRGVLARGRHSSFSSLVDLILCFITHRKKRRNYATVLLYELLHRRERHRANVRTWVISTHFVLLEEFAIKKYRNSNNICGSLDYRGNFHLANVNTIVTVQRSWWLVLHSPQSALDRHKFGNSQPQTWGRTCLHRKNNQNIRVVCIPLVDVRLATVEGFLGKPRLAAFPEYGRKA